MQLDVHGRSLRLANGGQMVLTLKGAAQRAALCTFEACSNVCQRLLTPFAAATVWPVKGPSVVSVELAAKSRLTGGIRPQSSLYSPPHWP
jgi:hypothetical protein